LILIVELKSFGKALGMNIIAYFWLMASYWIIPPILEAIASITTIDEIQGFGYFILILSWVFFCVIISGVTYYNALTMPTPKEYNKMMMMILAIAIALLTGVFLLKNWWFIQAMQSGMSTNIQIIVFYTQIVMNMIIFMFLLPYNMIIEARKPDVQ
jgi:hypothetical protein